MSLIRRKDPGRAWETEVDTGGGGSLPDPITETVNIDVADTADVALHIGDHVSASIPATVEILGFDGQDVGKDLLLAANFDEDGFFRVNYDGSVSLVAAESADRILQADGGTDADTVFVVRASAESVRIQPINPGDVVLALGRATGQTASIIAYDGDGTWYLNPDGSVTMFEQTEPPAPPANAATIFCKDNGGKTQLCVRFASGASQVIATEP